MGRCGMTNGGQCRRESGVEECRSEGDDSISGFGAEKVLEMMEHGDEGGAGSGVMWVVGHGVPFGGTQVKVDVSGSEVEMAPGQGGEFADAQ